MHILNAIAIKYKGLECLGGGMFNNHRHLLILIGTNVSVLLVLALLLNAMEVSFATSTAALIIISSLSIAAIQHFLQSSNRTSMGSAAEDDPCEVTAKYNEAGRRIIDTTSGLAINSAEVAFFIEKLAASITHSGEDANQIAKSTKELVANTKQINHSAATTAELAHKAMSASSDSREQLMENVESISHLNTDVTSASERIQVLADKAIEIQGITDVIDSIAQQTNLLALNAAIEAARAGEQGRGFAVVADEVRALASKTADATDRIGQMLREITSETQNTTEVMTSVVDKSQNFVEVTQSLSEAMVNINNLMQESSVSIEIISGALKEQDETTEKLSGSIANIGEFLQERATEIQKVSKDANQLARSTETIFVHLEEFHTDSLLETMSQQAAKTAQEIGELFESEIDKGNITQGQLFDRNYKEVPNTNPQKHVTQFDQFTDEVLPAIQEPLLEEFPEMIYAGAVDNNGYFPTHNNKFSHPMTGDYEEDIAKSRNKRIFNDPTGSRCGAHQETYLLQTYKRDTGEIMHDVSAPIYVHGQHWGGFRIGFKAAN